MSSSKPQTTFFRFAADLFRETLLLFVQQGIIRECDYVKALEIGASRIKPVPNAPDFLELTITSNDHHWCLLAFWDHRYYHTDYLIFTHGFIKVNDLMPQGELDKAQQALLEHFKGNKGVV